MLASFFVEGILSKEGFKKNFENLGAKYAMSLPVEFAGFVSFALLSFSTNPDEVVLLGIQISATVIACGFLVDAYDHYFRPKLMKIKLTDKQSILAIIAITILTIFLGIYFFNLNPLI